MNVFVLAAGRGERLRPITDHIPKPLLPILGRPIIDYVFESVATLNPKYICVNVHHHCNQLLDWLREHPLKERIVPYYEPDILGTGGCLYNAKENLMTEQAFLTHNADILCELPLNDLLEAHLRSNNIATLAVIDHQEVNSLCLDSEGLLIHVNAHNCRHLRRTFTGIAVYASSFLGFLYEGPSSVVEGWLRAIDAGHRIGTFDITGTYWSDIGTPQRYAYTVFKSLRRQGESVYIDHSFKGCHNLTYEGVVVIESGCHINSPIRLKDCILMPNTRVEAPNNVVGQIVSNGYRVPINRNGLAGRLGFGGSDRSFYRVGYKGQSAIRMQTTSDDPDFQRHIEYTRLFKRHGIPVPELLKVEDLTAFFEDLGDLSLYNWLKCNREEKAIFETYHKVIDALVRLHSLKLDQDSPPFRDFDYEYFRWETDYFLREFVNGYLGIQWVPPQVLYDLDRLALEAASFKKVIIHRDLQSQNIMIKGDGTIAFIDYQGARFGPPAYDVASLCFDPYVDIDVSLRMRFCDTYKSVIIAIDETFDVTTFDRSLQICRLQRLMQALGAYAYLSLKKGRFHFLKYIPSALSLLKDSVVGSGDQFLGLKNLIQTIKTRVHTLDRPLKPV